MNYKVGSEVETLWPEFQEFFIPKKKHKDFENRVQLDDLRPKSYYAITPEPDSRYANDWIFWHGQAHQILLWIGRFVRFQMSPGHPVKIGQKASRKTVALIFTALPVVHVPEIADGIDVGVDQPLNTLGDLWIPTSAVASITESLKPVF